MDLNSHKKRVLIVEAYNHSKVLRNVFFLLKNRFIVTFYVNKDKRKTRELLFPEWSQAEFIVNRFHSSSLFLWLLYYGRKFDFINISTGPEGDHFSELLNVLAFFFCCVLYGNKIVLTVKRIHPYLSSTGGFFCWVRSKAIKRLRRFTFETRTMGRIFSEVSGVKKPFIGVSYDRYIDLIDPNILTTKFMTSSKKIRIGLLGVFNEEKRKYDMLIDVLKCLPIETRDRLVFVALGGVRNEDDRRVVRKLAAVVDLDWLDGWFSENEFEKRGASCDILFSPLREGYGVLNSTGAFGDAVYLRKKIILPSYVDEDKEFGPIAIYYESEHGLFKIFENIERIAEEGINQGYYQHFTTDSVFSQLLKDLRCY